MSNAPLLALGALTLGVVGYVAVNLPQGPGDALDARLAALEQQTAAVQAMQRELRDSIARVDRRVATIASRSHDVGSSAVAAGGSAGGAESGDPADDGGGVSPVREDALGAESANAVGDAVASRIERRIEAIAARERARGGDGKWKAPIDELSNELEIDAAKKAEVVQVLDAGRDRVCEVLLARRADGTSILDDYAGALRAGADAGTTTQAFFKRIVAEKVPESDETYFAAIMKVHEGVERDLATRLDATRMEKLRALRVDLLDVKTGHDPVGDAVRERLSK